MNPFPWYYPLSFRLVKASFTILKDVEVKVLASLVNVLVDGARVPVELRNVKLLSDVQNHVFERLTLDSDAHAANGDAEKHEILKAIADDVKNLYLTPKA